MQMAVKKSPGTMALGIAHGTFYEPSSPSNYNENQHAARVFKSEYESNTERSGSVAKNPSSAKVTYEKDRHKWKAQICYNGMQARYLFRHESKAVAQAFYDAALKIVSVEPEIDIGVLRTRVRALLNL
jgi:hypothetical protein